VPSNNTAKKKSPLTKSKTNTVSLIRVFRKVPATKHEDQLPRDCRKMRQRQLAKASRCKYAQYILISATIAAQKKMSVVGKVKHLLQIESHIHHRIEVSVDKISTRREGTTNLLLSKQSISSKEGADLKICTFLLGISFVA